MLKEKRKANPNAEILKDPEIQSKFMKKMDINIEAD